MLLKLPDLIINAFLKNPEELHESDSIDLQARISFHIHLWALVVMLPLSFVQYVNDNMILAALLIVGSLIMAIVIYFQKVKNHSLFNGRAFVIFAPCLIIYSTYINGLHGLIWAFPVTTTLFFLLGAREGLIINSIFIALLTIYGIHIPDTGTFIRAQTSLLLLTIFTYLFAWLVEIQGQKLRQLASTDVLTGCCNRLVLNRVMNHVASMKLRYDQPTSLMMMDIDYFKKINDIYGHMVGDEVLKELTRLLKDRLRTADILIRYGGEEFLTILPNTRIQEAESLARSLVDLIGSYSFNDINQLTVSIGVSELRANEKADQCISRTDSLLYDAKRAGRNRVVSCNH